MQEDMKELPSHGDCPRRCRSRINTITRYTTRSGASFRAERIKKERQRLSRKIKFSRGAGPSLDGKPAKVCVRTVKQFARCTYRKRRIGGGQKRNYMADKLVAPVGRANKNGGQKCDSVLIQSQIESPSAIQTSI